MDSSSSPESEEVRVLVLALVTVRVVEVAGVAGEERRARHVQEIARDELHLLERERGLAASGRAHDDERGRQSEERLLRVVEAQHLVKEVEARVRRVDEAERRELVLGRAAAAERLELRFVHPRAAQEARLLVGVVLDHLEQERVALAVPAGEAEEQPVRVVELRPVVALAAELLDIGRVQVVALQHRDHFLVAGAHRGRIEIAMDEDFHREESVRRPFAPSAPGPARRESASDAALAENRPRRCAAFDPSAAEPGRPEMVGDGARKPRRKPHALRGERPAPPVLPSADAHWKGFLTVSRPSST